MRILGVDPGSRLCGYGVIDVTAAAGSRQRPGAGHSPYAYVECGVLTATAAAPAEQRLGEIARWLADVINELRPAVIVVEDVFSHLNPRTALALAQARGAVLAVAGMSGLAVHSYAPALVKKSVTGRGRASKDQVARMVQVLVGLRRVPGVDASDALAVAITHAHQMSLTQRLDAAVLGVVH